MGRRTVFIGVMAVAAVLAPFTSTVAQAAPQTTATTAPQTVSCTASSVISVFSLLGPNCATPQVVCPRACFLTGTVTATSPLKLGPVAAQLDTRTTFPPTVIAMCAANAATCTGTSPPGGKFVPAGSYAGVCTWKQPPNVLAITAKVACSMTATACFGRPECPWQNGEMVTYRADRWGDPIASPGQLLQARFGTVYFTSGGSLRVGGAESMVFTSATAVHNYLPSVGLPGPLTSSYVDPTSTASGQYGGEVVALKLNIDFSDAGYTLGSAGIRFGDLTLCGLSFPTLNGRSLREFLAINNTALGGGTALLPIADLSSLTASANAAFLDGSANLFAQNNLVNGPCPT